MTTSSLLPSPVTSPGAQITSPYTSVLSSSTTTQQPSIRSDVSRAPLPSPFSFGDHVRGTDVGDGWTQYTPPHKDFKYFYHRELQLVTNYDIPNRNIRTDFLSRYRQTATENHPLETFVQEEVDHENEAAIVDHDMETLNTGEMSPNASRASYWKYLHVYPCHYKLPDSAEKQALRILHLAMALNLAKEEFARTPFSMQDIQRYMDYFKFFQSVSTPCDDDPVAKAIIVTVVIANFYDFHDRSYVNSVNPTPAMMSPIKKIILNVVCCGIPPDYHRRFELASSSYQQTFHQEVWESYLNQVREERATANVVSGLLLTSSVAFLAIPDLVDIAQFFIILAIALALCCLVIGLNSRVEEMLSEIQQIQALELQSHIEKTSAMARAMEYHYTALLLSVFCFVLSLSASTAYNIYAGVFLDKVITVRYLFFAMAAAGIIIIIWTTARLNQQLL